MNQQPVPQANFNLMTVTNLFVQQTHEAAEFFGYETRNKYQILDKDKMPIAFAAEQQKGFWNFLVRQFLGHWRSFEIHIFDSAKQKVLVARHPFRFYFQRLEILDANGKLLGAVQQRFSLLSKRFDIENHQGMAIMEVASPIWKLWTFPFIHNGKQIACVQKKFSGLFSEVFTDRDNFMVEFTSPDLKNSERQLVLASALFIDLMYFEAKAGR